MLRSMKEDFLKKWSLSLLFTSPYYLLLFRVVAYKSLFDDKPYAYGDYINGKLVNFEIY
jgi:hypothetical protein